MTIFDARTLPASDNSSDTLIGGVHLNLTTLDYWNYTLYSNGTLSNGTWCLLAFDPYTPPLVYPNGSFANATWCWYPANPIATRASVGLGFTVAYGLALVLTLVALAKHGKLYLPAEKRFYPIGRRWQWYWASFVCAAAIVSLITNIDVDRYYLPELPIILNVFFWYLMQMGTAALVWEAVRHWGSWMERQFIDPNPFVLPRDDKRAQFEFWLPLVFYFWLWLNFFLIIPRNWERIQYQRYPEQTLTEAMPAATDGRFKAASFVLFVCWLVITVSLRHSIKHYCPRNRGLVNRTIGIIRFTPLRFLLLLPLLLSLVAYQSLASFSFPNSPQNLHPSLLAMYLGGYTPSLLIILINAIHGFATPNEDRALLAQRRVRVETIDRELGIVRKPAWWRRLAPDAQHPGESMSDRIARNVREVGGGRATDRNVRARVEGQNQQQGVPAGETTAPDIVEMSTLRTNTESISRSGMGSRMVVPVRNNNPARTASHPAPMISSTIPVATPKYNGKSDRRRAETTVQAAGRLLFPAEEQQQSATSSRVADLMADGPSSAPRPPPPPYTDEPGRGRTTENGNGQGSALRSPNTERSNSTATSNSVTAPPVQIRSMLDV